MKNKITLLTLLNLTWIFPSAFAASYVSCFQDSKNPNVGYRLDVNQELTVGQLTLDGKDIKNGNLTCKEGEDAMYFSCFSEENTYNVMTFGLTASLYTNHGEKPLQLQCQQNN